MAMQRPSPGSTRVKRPRNFSTGVRLARSDMKASPEEGEKKRPAGSDRAPFQDMRQATRSSVSRRTAATIALTVWDDAAGFCRYRRESKELTSVVISRAVVATAASPETMCRMRGDIPLLMFISFNWFSKVDPMQGGMLGPLAATLCQRADTRREMASGRCLGHDPGAHEGAVAHGRVRSRRRRALRRIARGPHDPGARAAL